MTWVITRLCQDCVDTACVAVCPVECIYKYNGSDLPNQLYIHPDECIDCGACEPECPWEAIFEDAQVPGVFKADSELNAKIVDDDSEFEVAENDEKDPPSPDDKAANFKKHGYSG